MHRVRTLSLALFLIAGPLSAQNLNWMLGCWQCDPADNVTLFEHWERYGDDGYHILGGTIKDGTTVEKMYAYVTLRDGQYHLRIVFDTVGESEWNAAKVSSSSITWKEDGGAERTLFVTRSGSTITSKVYDSGGNLLNELTYTRIQCQ